VCYIFASIFVNKTSIQINSSITAEIKTQIDDYQPNPFIAFRSLSQSTSALNVGHGFRVPSAWYTQSNKTHTSLTPLQFCTTVTLD